MSREDIIAVASRLLAIYLAVLASQPVASLLSVPDSHPLDTSFVLTQLAVSLALVVVAALLWFFPVTVARKLLPVMRTPQPALTVGGHLALSLALAVLGFWVLAQALPDTIYWLTFVLLSSRALIPLELLPEHKAGMIATAVELAIAVGLILGHRAIAGWLRHMRYGNAAGQPDQQGAL